ncbi:MAG: hypothetical protein ACI8T1_002532 [Verrucomicrobiales bacterium]|jgi:hypothetical protein
MALFCSQVLLGFEHRSAVEPGTDGSVVDQPLSLGRNGSERRLSDLAGCLDITGLSLRRAVNHARILL